MGYRISSNIDTINYELNPYHHSSVTEITSVILAPLLPDISIAVLTPGIHINPFLIISLVKQKRLKITPDDHEFL